MCLTNKERSRVVELSLEGTKQSDIAKIFKVSQACISKIIKKWGKTGLSTSDQGLNSSPKFKADFVERILKLRSEKPTLPLRKVANEITASTGISISHTTVKNIYNDNSIFACSPAKKPLLTKRHKKLRYEAAQKWLLMEESDVKRIIFSDESKFNLRYSDGKLKVWREPGRAHDQKYVVPTVKFGGGSVMVWACFSYNGVGKLVFIDGTMDAVEYVSIISQNLSVSAREMKLKSFIFQQDNDPKHTAALARDYFEVKKIELLDWPPQSPDLNPIENLWAYIKCKIASSNPKNVNELKDVIIEAWNSIPPEIYQKLALSFIKRRSAVLRAKGSYTKY